MHGPNKLIANAIKSAVHTDDPPNPSAHLQTIPIRSPWLFQWIMHITI